MKVQTTVTLTERQEAFVRALADGARPTRASLIAGYSVGHTAALLQKPAIVAALVAMRSNLNAVLATIDPPEQRETA